MDDGRFDGTEDAESNGRGFAVHRIDPVLVRAQVEKRVARIRADGERAKATADQKAMEYANRIASGRGIAIRPPEGVERIDARTRQAVRIEEEHHGRVRVVERMDPDDGPSRFLLVYGEGRDGPDAFGTGPFATLERAKSWFLDGGR